MTVLSNTIYILVEKILRMVAGIVVFSILARQLGPDYLGIYNYIIAFVLIFSPIGVMGLEALLVKKIVFNESEEKQLLVTAFWLKFLGSLLCYLLIYICSSIFEDNDEYKLWIQIYGLSVFFQSMQVTELYNQAKLNSKVNAIINIVAVTILSFIKILIVIKGFDFNAIVAITTIDGLYAFLLFYFYQTKILKINLFSNNFSYVRAIDFLRDCLPLMITGLIVMSYMKVDQIMIRHMLSVNDLGYYVSAVKLSEMPYFLPGVIIAGILPFLIRQKKNGITEYQESLTSTYSFLIWLGVIVYVPMIILSDYLIYFFYGEGYQVASSVLKLHAFTGIFVFVGVAYTRHLIIVNKAKLVLIRSVTSLFLNIALNFFFLQKFGVVGAALSTLLTQVFVVIISDLFTSQGRFDFLLKVKSINPFYAIKLIPSIISFSTKGGNSVK